MDYKLPSFRQRNLNPLDIISNNFLRETLTLASYSSSIPAADTQLFSVGVRKEGGFNPYVRKLTLRSNIDVDIVLQIKSAVGIPDTSGLALVGRDISLKALTDKEIEFNSQLLWGQSIFVIFKSTSATGTLTLKLFSDQNDTSNKPNLYADFAYMGIGDSILRGANSTIQNDPNKSWFSLVYKKYNELNNFNVLALNKGVPGITAEGFNLALQSGFCETDKIVGLITICLGTNTSASDSAYTTAMQAILDYCMLRYPLAKIAILAPIMRADASESTLVRYRVILQTIVSNKNNPLVKFFDTSIRGIVSGVAGSQVHPDDIGHGIFATDIIGFLTSSLFLTVPQ